MPATVNNSTASTVARRCRDRWTRTRFRQAGDAVTWVDGPARLDVIQHLASTGMDRARLERDGVDLRRRVSRPVVAAVALAALEAVGHRGDGSSAGGAERVAGRLLDELQLVAIPDDGPPPLIEPTIPPDALWRRARVLAGLLPSTRPVALDRPNSWRPVLRRLGTLAVLAGAALDERGQRSWRPRDRDGVEKLVGSGIDGPHPLTMPLRFPGWPDQLFVAVTHLRDPFGVVPPVPHLHWEDGPSPRQVTDQVAREGLPDPLVACRHVETARILSPTAVAASVLLYRMMHDEAYRDDGARYHWMARWKSEQVRRIDQRWRFARQRLARIQAVLLERPLPLTGELPATLRPVVDGPRLWAAAETLLALTPTGGKPPTDPTIRRASLPVELAGTLEEVSHESLQLLISQ